MIYKLFLIIKIKNLVSETINSQYISNEHQYVFPTKSIILECTVKNYSPETDVIEWCKNNFCTWGRPIELSDGRLQYKSLPRYFIIGNRNKGIYKRSIKKIR